MQVVITSFSYLDGYPTDGSVHGGGFVFDCRLLHNPHKIPELKTHNGKEQVIIDYLDQQPDAQAFARHVFALVDMAITSYQKRDFTHLSVAFGCMGGMHRSVYMAERLARHIREHFPDVAVELVHAKGW